MIGGNIINEINFTFFENYAKVIEELENENDKKDFLLAIYLYIYKDELPDFKGMKKIAWLGLVSSLETSKNRALGKKNKTKTIEKQKENKKKTNKKQTPSISISISNSLKEYYKNKELNNIFLEYLKLRKKLKAVNSDRAINSLINILSDYDDETKIKLIEQSIVNSWKSIYPLKNNNQKKKTAFDLIDEL